MHRGLGLKETAIVLLLASPVGGGARTGGDAGPGIEKGDEPAGTPVVLMLSGDAPAESQSRDLADGLARALPDRTLLFRPPGPSQAHGPTVVATVVLAAAPLLLIAAIVREHRQGARARAALAESYIQLRGLAGRLVTVQEEERRRIAREVHDDIGQRVASLSIGLSAAKRKVPRAEGALAEELSMLQEQARKVAADLRQLSHDLHPGSLEQLGLKEALRDRCAQVQAETGIEVALEVEAGWPEVEGAAALCLYRVAQEALRNVAQHARAQSARVSLERREALAVMRVEDDGCGFEEAATRFSGIGLVSLRERVRLLGGTLEVATAKAAGTAVTVSLPVGGTLAT